MPRIPDMALLLGALPGWASLLVVCIVIAYCTCVFGVAFGKMGRSPYWGLAFTLPLLGTILLWTFGLGRWPRQSGNVDMESGL